MMQNKAKSQETTPSKHTVICMLPQTTPVHRGLWACRQKLAELLGNGTMKEWSE